VERRQPADVRRDRLRRSVGHRPALHRRSAAPRAVAAGLHQPDDELYKRLVPGFEAPINLVYSQRNRSACVRIPITGSNPKAKRLEFRCPDSSGNPYLAFAAMLMAGLDGIKNKIEPQTPVDKDLYELPPEEAANIPQAPTQLSAVIDRFGSGPRIPHRGRCFHARPDRDVDQLQAGERDPAGPDPAAPVRVRALLRRLNRLSGLPSKEIG